MKYIYILTENGRAWNQAGLNWIEKTFKPAVHETDQTRACAGKLYNSPGLMVKELTEHPDSYVIISYDRICAMGPEDLPGFVEALQKHIDDEDYQSSWQIAREYIGS